MRITKKMIYNRFFALCNMLGKRVAKSYNDVGGWTLDYAACYGGWVINEVVNEYGGQSMPLGMERHNNKEFYNMLCFATNAVHLKS